MSGWKLSNFSIEKEEAIKLNKKFNGKELYVCLEPQYIYTKKINKAICKGLAQSENSDGIIIEKNLIELSYSEDKKFYTNILYENEDGDLLAILSHKLCNNYKIVKKISSKIKIEQIKCPNVYQKKYNLVELVFEN